EVARQLAEARAAAEAAHAEEDHAGGGRPEDGHADGDQDVADGTYGPSYLRGRPYQARAANF
ncbi:MAG: hypothetical protein WCA46_00170, partial [Actinocatenispora sp.]